VGRFLYLTLVLIVAFLATTITLDLGFIRWSPSRVVDLARLSRLLALTAFLEA